MTRIPKHVRDAAAKFGLTVEVGRGGWLDVELIAPDGKAWEGGALFAVVAWTTFSVDDPIPWDAVIREIEARGPELEDFEGDGE